MNTETRVKNIISEQFGISIANVKSEAALMNDLGADSLDMVEIVMELEDEFKIEIDDDDPRCWTTVQQIIDYVAAKVPA